MLGVIELNDFLSVTELSGDDVTEEQVERIYNRYYWAGKYCAGKDVIEVACGTGQGAGYLSILAKSYTAGDYSEDILRIARNHYGDRITFIQFDAQELPYPNNSMDVIILFEAIYYIPSADKFVRECQRVLKEGGKVLIATANKDLFDFNPSPYTYKYYGVVELKELFAQHGFSAEFYGDTPLKSLSWRQKLLRPVKKAAVELGLVPKSMAGKKLLKKLVFGNLIKMPAEITDDMAGYEEPTKLSPSQADKRHKVIYCSATLLNKADE